MESDGYLEVIAEVSKEWLPDRWLKAAWIGHIHSGLKISMCAVINRMENSSRLPYGFLLMASELLL